MARRSFLFAAIVVAALVFAAPAMAYNESSGTAPSQPAVNATAASPRAVTSRAAPPCRSTRPPARYDHVVWIWFENHGRDAVIGSSQAPYFNAIARACGQASRYSAITHPSLPNYIAATSGGVQGIRDDGSPSSRRTSAVSVFQLARSWKSYQESMPRPCALKNGSTYLVRHDPAAYYLRIRSQLCTRDVPLGSPTSGALASDLRHNHLPKFSFITPNRCNDMHDCGVPKGDAWLHHFLPVLLNSNAYRAGKTAIFITFDEGGAGNRVATIAIAPSVRRGSTIKTSLNHYSLLRTTQLMLGLRPLLGAAAHARDMRAGLHL
jgi:hypothetical protein